jgi:hypothetical protein
MAMDSKRQATAAKGTADESHELGSLWHSTGSFHYCSSKPIAFGITLTELDLADIEPERDLL